MNTSDTSGRKHCQCENENHFNGSKVDHPYGVGKSAKQGKQVSPGYWLCEYCVIAHWPDQNKK